MRINVYAEELTNEVETITKTMPDGRVFTGIRVFLKSPPELHHTPRDDDRSAITFWVPYYNGASHPNELNEVFTALHNESAKLL